MDRKDRIGQIVEMHMVSVTPGMAKALGKGEVAKHCAKCGLDCPKYPGRYPKLCPACGYDWEVPGEIELETEERRHRIEGLLEFVEKSSEPRRYEVLERGPYLGESLSAEKVVAMLREIGSRLPEALDALADMDVSSKKIDQLQDKIEKQMHKVRSVSGAGKDASKEMHKLAVLLDSQGLTAIWPA